MSLEDWGPAENAAPFFGLDRSAASAFRFYKTYPGRWELMKNWFYAVFAKLLGRNLACTPKEVILDQLVEPRPLPMGRTAFNEWSERLISGALLPFEGDENVFKEGQKFALANMLLHLGPTESHKPDAHFIHSLRKFAVNQVAHEISVELKKAAEARLAAEKEKEADAKAI